MFRALIKFHKGMMRMPIPWRLWLMLLVAVNLVLPLLLIGHIEAQLVVAVFFVSMALMVALTMAAGFTRLMGLGHIIWIGLLGFLVLRLGQIPADDLFGVWIRVLIALNAISLVIDAIDVVRYIGGDRAETVKGL
ncbi:hypothetical protein LCGC14_1591000 [marine sediment metagenome]|uniref:Uncharacterized protein n=1 Tax=marine sediment metagenome TaxID=412755 RepID=A0A0F9LEF2_9ZZZZ